MNSPTPSHPTITLGELIDSGAIEVTSGFPCGDHNSHGAGVLQIRPFNVTANASISLDTQKHVPGSAATGRPILEPGDILFNNTNTKELVGKTAAWNGPPGSVFSNHMTRIRPTVPAISSIYLANAIHAHWVTGRSEMLARSHVAQASILGERFREIEIPWPTEADRIVFADAFEAVQDSIQLEADIIQNLTAIKATAMRELFTRGLRDEAQKDSEIGPLPASWEVWAVSDATAPLRFDRSVQLQTREYLPAGKWPIIDQGQKLVAGYTDAEHRVIKSDSPVIIFGDHTRILKFLDTPFALGADGTKPLTAREGWNPRFLYHALCQLDIPSRGYNRHFKQLAASLIPKPSNDEQIEIAETLDAIDAKIDLHQRKKAVLEELFRSLLHKLMTDEIRVSDLDLSALQSPEEEVPA